MLTKARLRKFTQEALDFTIKDLRDVIAIQEEGVMTGQMVCPKLGQYNDELHLCAEEKRRRKGKDICQSCRRPL